jgi:hypothetical protein
MSAAGLGSSVPLLTTLRLHHDARRIADLDPDRARIGSKGPLHPLGDDPLGAKPASMFEHGRPIPGEVATIRRVEVVEGEIPATSANEAALRSALEAAGVEFIDENGGGPGVRLKKPLRKRT